MVKPPASRKEQIYFARHRVVEPDLHNFGIHVYLGWYNPQIMSDEILEKYTSLKETLSHLVSERDELLTKLGGISLISHHSSSDFVITLDVEELQTVIKEIAGIANKIQATIAEINILAQECGKPSVEIIALANRK